MIPALDPAVQRALRESTPGERILWAGQPEGRRMTMAFALWLFAIPWTAFSLAWEAMALIPLLSGSISGTKAPSGMMLVFGIVFPLFGLPFVAIGFWMLWQPIAAVRRARRTVYALTDRRLIEVIVGAATSVKSVMLDRIGPIERSAGPDGWGTLRVQTGSHVDSDGDRITDRFEMIGIPDVVGLERRILELQRGSG